MQPLDAKNHHNLILSSLEAVKDIFKQLINKMMKGCDDLKKKKKEKNHITDRI